MARKQKEARKLAMHHVFASERLFAPTRLDLGTL
jgi:hypothetical protein